MRSLHGRLKRRHAGFDFRIDVLARDNRVVYDNADDDEDGSVDEDWLDAVVFYLQGDSLIERHPVPWDETENGFVSGRDFVETVIAEGVTRFRVERPVPTSFNDQLVDLTLELTSPTGEIVSLSARVRTGSAL